MGNLHSSMTTTTDNGDTHLFSLMWEAARRQQLPRHSVPLCFTRSNIIDWNHRGESVCVYRQIGPVDWPLVQLGRVRGAANINTSCAIHTSSSRREKSRWIHINILYSIHHQVDSLLSWQWKWAWEMSLQLYCIHIIKSNYGECKRSECRRIKGHNIICLQNNDQSFTGYFKQESNYQLHLSVHFPAIVWVQKTNWLCIHQEYSCCCI